MRSIFRDDATVKQIATWIGSVSAILTLIGGAIWSIQSSQINDLKDKVDTYEKSENWKLPETLRNINTASNKLSLNIDERNSFEKLKLEKTTLSENNSKLEKDIKNIREELEKSNEALNAIVLKNDIFSLGYAQSIPLVNNDKYLSVASIYPNFIALVFDEQNSTLDVGKSVHYKVGTVDCKVVLTSIAPGRDTATFTRSCTEAGKK